MSACKHGVDLDLECLRCEDDYEKIRRRQHPTNVEFITSLMERSKQGALMQVFIIEAINNYSERSIASSPWPAGHFINQDAWKRCAQESLDAIKARS
jgi:hypothetical protein